MIAVEQKSLMVVTISIKLIDVNARKNSDKQTLKMYPALVQHAKTAMKPKNAMD